MWGGRGSQRLTESAFRRLGVVKFPWDTSTKYSPRSGSAEVRRLTESAFRRLEVARVPLG